MKRRHFLSSTILATIPLASLAKSENNKNTTKEAVVSFTENTNDFISTQDIHNELKKVCSTSKIGCAINSSWLINQTLLNIRSSSVAINKINLPTANPKINVGVEIDTSSITLAASGGKILLSGFNPKIVLKESKSSNRIYNKIQVTFSNTDLKIDSDVYDSNKLRFYLLNTNPGFNLSDLEANIDENVVKDNGMDKQKFLLQQDVILFSNNLIALLDGFVGSIQFPKLLDAMKTFSIQTPYEYFFVQNYIFVTGQSKSIDFKCECAGSDGFRTNTQLTSNLSPNQPNNNGFQFTFSRTLSAITTASDRLKEVQEINNPNFAFYYPKQISFQPLINNAVMPAIAIGESNSFLAFEWFYKATANLKSGFPVIKIDASSKTIQVDWPLEILGGAGISLKIGCVYIPLIHSMVQGEVSPNKITISFTLTIDGNGVSLYAKPDYNASVNIKFFDPPMLDVILNVLMGSFGNNLISKGLKNSVNKLNFKLVDFTSAELQSKFGWLVNNSFDQDSVLVSFQSDNG